MAAGDASPRFTTDIFVTFRDSVRLDYTERAARQLDDLGIGSWKELTRLFPGISIRPLIHSITPEELRRLIARAQERDPAYRPCNFFAMFVVSCPGTCNPASLLERLRGWASVEEARLAPAGSGPGGSSIAADLSSQQEYLDPAPMGIDARFAWSMPDGGLDGSGQDFCDLELGWELQPPHEDLPTLDEPIYGTNHVERGGHGLAVLGIICALDDQKGCIGIAHGLSNIKLVAASYSSAFVPAAIAAAATNLPGTGGVLLIEHQITVPGYQPSHPGKFQAPAEVVPAIFWAIQLATKAGVVVIEAAGNGDRDLDEFAAAYEFAANYHLPGLTRPFLTPQDDSGAIMVGGCTPSRWVPLDRFRLAEVKNSRWINTGPQNSRLEHPGSNYGSRVDCFAWGERVVTLRSSYNNPQQDPYRDDFDGTSSAAAIVAGAALLVQQAADRYEGRRQDSLEMRVVLGDTQAGTPSHNPAIDRIGVMPDLWKILSLYLLVRFRPPDLYMPDWKNFHPHDDHPNFGSASVSPAILVTPAGPRGPARGDNPEIVTETAIARPALDAGDTWVVRTRCFNPTVADARDVDIGLHWSEPATFTPPDRWHRIGGVHLAHVPCGRRPTLSEAVPWQPEAGQSHGRYCVIANLERSQGTDLWDEKRRGFDDLVDGLQRGTIAFHTSHLVKLARARGSKRGVVSGSMKFVVRGATDAARWMALEILALLPIGSRLMFEVSQQLWHAFERPPAMPIHNRRQRSVRFPVGTSGLHNLGRVRLPANFQSMVTMWAEIPADRVNNTYDVVCRQLYRDVEIGGISWQLAPGSS